MTLHTIWGGERLLFFYEKPRPSDLRAVSQQMRGHKFDPSLILGTANRCRFGYPRVIVCSPLQAFVPFPTSFWLTCPWLLRHIGTVEAEGGVSELERWIKRRALQDWLFFNEDHRLIRIALLSPDTLDYLRRFRPKIFDSLGNVGVGGIRCDTNGPVRVKCIHLQTASWLTLGRHPGEEWLKVRGADGDCGGRMRDMCEG